MSIDKVPGTNESIEKPVSCLLIDDHAGIVTAMNEFDLRDLGFLAVACTSVAQAIAAIEKYNPNILLLDNSLTSGGNEGLEIAKIVKEKWPDMEIYSTTDNPMATYKYEKMGIKHVSKDLKEISALLED